MPCTKSATPTVFSCCSPNTLEPPELSYTIPICCSFKGISSRFINIPKVNEHYSGSSGKKNVFFFLKTQHRILECLGLEGTPEPIHVQATQDPIRPGLGHLQGWGVHSFNPFKVPVLIPAKLALTFATHNCYCKVTKLQNFIKISSNVLVLFFFSLSYSY